MRESCTYGSVRGAPSNGRPYRNRSVLIAKSAALAAPPDLAVSSARQLLALWNALPDVDKRKKVGDRDALIDQLWSAIEVLPVPEPQPDPKHPSKQDVVIAMLRQPEGATVEEVASVTGWQRHTVRASSRQP